MLNFLKNVTLYTHFLFQVQVSPGPSSSSVPLVPKKVAGLDENHFLFGRLLAKPPSEKLWTFLETINHFRFLKAALGKTKVASKEEDQIFKKLAEVMMSVYHSAFIPTFSFDYSWKLLRSEIKAEMKSASQYKKKLYEDEAYKKDWLNRLNKIFQFSIRCRCFIDATSIGDITRAGCSCKNEDKIPNLVFYKDQMFGRSIVNLLPEEDKAYFKRFMTGNFFQSFKTPSFPENTQPRHFTSRHDEVN